MFLSFLSFKKVFLCGGFILFYFLFCSSCLSAHVYLLFFFFHCSQGPLGLFSVRSFSDSSTPSILFLFFFLSRIIFGRRDSSFFRPVFFPSWSTAPDVTTPLAANLRYLSFLESNYTWPVIHQVVSDQGYYTFLYGHTKYNREGGRKEQTRTWVSSKRKKEEVYGTLCSSPCILHETSTKATNNVNSSLTDFSHWLLLLTVLPLHCYLKPTSLFFHALSTGSLCLLTDLPSLFYFQTRRRSRPRSFEWLSRQNRQRDRLSGTNTNGNELLRIVSQ